MAPPAPVPVPGPALVPVNPAAANAAALYAIVPADHVRYHGLFVGFDTDHDG
jgi:hypothetical protein